MSTPVPGDVARLLFHATTANLRMLTAERGLPAPAAIRDANASQRDFIQSCCEVADAYRSLDEVPREWRIRADREAS